MARGRRSDHTRDELRDLVLGEGTQLMAEVGYAGFSARELARRIGYSVSTVIGMLGGNDQLIMAINTRTFGLWAGELERALSVRPADRIATLVNAYFDFATRNPKLWSAIYDHRLPVGHDIPDDQADARGRLTGIVVAEVSQVLPTDLHGIAELTASLIFTVHGHCHMWITGSADLMGVCDVRASALSRVREILGAHRTVDGTQVRAETATGS